MNWRIKALPFIWSHRPEATNAPLPDILPFSLSVDPASGRFMQVSDTIVTDALGQAYRSGSVITGAMAESGLGRDYANDFFRCIKDTLHSFGKTSNARILEIGCGNGFLARTLALDGHTVVGIDPGPQLIESESRQLSLIRDFFPSPRIQGRFDLILAYALLEHIEDPQRFLASLRSYLTPGGEVLVAVPNCEDPIQLGDPSMLVHEHFSYFTPKSLTRTLELAGFTTQSVSQAGFGGMLYARAKSSASPQTSSSVDSKKFTIEQYKLRVETNLARLSELFHEADAQHKSIAVVVPGRIVNALSMLGISPERTRFCDDNPSLFGTYYPPFAIPIESTASLIKAPTDKVLIMSQTFGERIAARLRPALPVSTQLIIMDELFAGVNEPAH